MAIQHKEKIADGISLMKRQYHDFHERDRYTHCLFNSDLNTSFFPETDFTHPSFSTIPLPPVIAEIAKKACGSKVRSRFQDDHLNIATREIVQHLTEVSNVAKEFLYNPQHFSFRAFSPIMPFHISNLVDADGFSDHTLSVIHFKSIQAVKANLAHYGCEGGNNQKILFLTQGDNWIPFSHLLRGVPFLPTHLCLSVYNYPQLSLQYQSPEKKIVINPHNPFLIHISDHEPIRKNWIHTFFIETGVSENQQAEAIVKYNNLLLSNQST